MTWIIDHPVSISHVIVTLSLSARDSFGFSHTLIPFPANLSVMVHMSRVLLPREGVNVIVATLH
jgi:hypothetical protein